MKTIFVLGLIIAVGFFVARFFMRSKDLKNYHPSEVAQKMREPNVILLDVRTDSERERQKIEGSLHIPIQELEGRIKELEPYKDREIICYCAGGVRSVNAATTLKSSGYNASNLMGGLVAWNMFKANK